MEMENDLIYEGVMLFEPKEEKQSFGIGGSIDMPYMGQFLYPPRIENKVPPRTIEMFDNGTYIAQPKFNGSNTSVTISENSVVAKERHNTFFTRPPEFDFKALHRGEGLMCISGEFMNKSKKDAHGNPFKGFVIWDILALSGKLLVGATLEGRIELLDQLYPNVETIYYKGIPLLHKTAVPDIYKVANYNDNFKNIYDTITQVDMVEGLVLKRKNSKLGMMLKEENNTSWAIKARKSTKNYIF